MDGLSLLAAHLAGDFILQTDAQARTKFACRRARAAHVTSYTACFLPLVGRLGPARALAFLALLWTSHYVLDSRRWASGEAWAPKPMMVDQALHVIVLAALRRLLAR